MCTTILMEGIVATTHSVVNIGFYIIAANDSVVNMAITSLQQLIRWSIWAITSLQQLIRWSIWPLHRCSKRFGGQYGHYIVATADSVVNMAFYIVAATCFHK